MSGALAIWLIVLLVVAMSKINWRTIWFDQKWRHELTNAVITSLVLGVFGIMGTAIFLLVKNKQWPLAAFVIGGALVGSLLGLCSWIIAHNDPAIDDKPKEKDEKPNVAATSPSIRLKYSSRQVIENKLGDPEQIINLDNLAILRLWSCGADLVDFLLTTVSGSTSIKSPSAGQDYKIGGGTKIVFPSSNAVVESAMVVTGPSKEVRFDLNNRTKRIMVNERIFQVRLDHISDESSGAIKTFKYAFLITEE